MATQKFMGALRAPVAEPPFRISKSTTDSPFDFEVRFLFVSPQPYALFLDYEI